MEENVLLKLHPTRLAFLKSYMLALVLAIVWYVAYFDPLKVLTALVPYKTYTFIVLGLAVLLAIISEIRVIIDTYIITDHRVTQRVGLLSIKESSVNWDRIADVRMNQTLFERIFGIGTITIESTGGNEEPEVTFREIGNVHRVKETIDKEILESKGGASSGPTLPASKPGGGLVKK